MLYTSQRIAPSFSIERGASEPEGENSRAGSHRRWCGQRPLPPCSCRGGPLNRAKLSARLSLPPRAAAGAPPNGGDAAWSFAARAEAAGVRLAGRAPDLLPFLNAARVFVSPIRDGTGVNTKNVLALTHGVPLVTTPTGAMGMFPEEAAAAGALAIADGPRAFAEAVLRLYADLGAWGRQAEAGAAFSKAFCPDMLKRDILDSWCARRARAVVAQFFVPWISCARVSAARPQPTAAAVGLCGCGRRAADLLSVVVCYVCPAVAPLLAQVGRSWDWEQPPSCATVILMTRRWSVVGLLWWGGRQQQRQRAADSLRRRAAQQPAPPRRCSRADGKGEPK